MRFSALFFLAVGLSMDALAVAICKGLAMPGITWKQCTIVGLWFGGFQALMPLIGYLLGVGFENRIKQIDHWIAFALLVLIGANMIREACHGEEESETSSLDAKTMLLLAIATSIDALAVGVTFAFLSVSIIPAISLIGITTFAISFAGVILGHQFGSRYRKKAEIAGGVILIILGVKILLEHLGI